MIKSTIQAQRDFFRNLTTRPLKFRIEALKRLRSAILNNRQLLEEALYRDLSKSPFESYTTEIGMVLSEIDCHIGHLRRWMKPHRVPTPLFLMPSRSRVVYQPLGCVLIIAPWNYPLQLTLNPLVGAISAGDCAILKPSPAAAASADAIVKIINETFPENYIHAFPGDEQTMQELLAEKFDHIFYTGGGRFGKTVMQAAARHLTPVTLELGGKSPCIVDSDADIQIAARRIGWGKFLNAGQTCVAPDYVLVHKSVKESFTAALKDSVERFFGTDPAASPDYPRIINEKSVRRLTELLQGAGRIVFGGSCDTASKYFAPTAVEVHNTECQLMRQEIFGPILPIIEYDNIRQALDFIAGREKPLALYYFGRKKSTARRIIAETASGGVCINDTVVHLGNRYLPFGGIGESGMGKYHGHDSFAVFSNRKAVLHSPASIDIPLRYAPYRWQSIIEKLL